jgi:hypothetical protein
VVGHQCLCHANKAPGFIPEKSGGLDDLLDIGWVGARKIEGCGVPGK